MESQIDCNNFTDVIQYFTPQEVPLEGVSKKPIWYGENKSKKNGAAKSHWLASPKIFPKPQKRPP